MSADNYLWIREWKGKWYVQMEFASVKPDKRRKPPKDAWGPFDTQGEAVMEALEEDSKGYYEYGVSLDRVF